MPETAEPRLAGGLVLTAALVIRFVPYLADEISGPPRYMEAFADLMGRQIANATRDPDVVMEPWCGCDRLDGWFAEVTGQPREV